MVDEPGAHHCDRLEPAVGMARKPGHHVAVIHAPAVLAAEVHADMTPGQRGGGGHPFVSRRVGVEVVHTEEEGVGSDPGKA